VATGGCHMYVSLRIGTTVALASFGVLSMSTPATAGAGPSGPPGQLVIVQAVPQASVDVSLDGHVVHRGSPVGSVLGPFTVSPGVHHVAFSDAAGTMRLTSSVTVAPDSSSDVVVHLPAEVDGAPVVNSYRTPTKPIAAGKTRVLIAHTATVAPADVRVDGTVVFKDIANGEYATADLAAGEHTAALLPTGQTSDPILGPLHVDLPARTATMVYAYGSPRDHSMNVIAHQEALTSNGAVAPATIDTGSTGLAGSLVVHPFRAPEPPRQASPRAAVASDVVAPGVVALMGAAVLLMLRRRRRSPSRLG